MGILTEDESLIDAALSEILSLPLDRRRLRDPRRDVTYLLIQQYLEQVNFTSGHIWIFLTFRYPLEQPVAGERRGTESRVFRAGADRRKTFPGVPHLAKRRRNSSACIASGTECRRRCTAEGGRPLRSSGSGDWTNSGASDGSTSGHVDPVVEAELGNSGVCEEQDVDIVTIRN